MEYVIIFVLSKQSYDWQYKEQLIWLHNIKLIREIRKIVSRNTQYTIKELWKNDGLWFI